MEEKVYWWNRRRPVFQLAMTPRKALTSESVLRDAQDFSLVLGGPLFQLLRRVHLSDDALTLLHHRVLVISLLAWLPLLMLSTLQGNLLGGGVAVPFLYDIEVHVRFLVAVPLLIIAELVAHRRMRPIAQSFLERKIISEVAFERFDDAVSSALRLRNSVLAEVILLALVYVVGVVIIWRHFTALQAATWYATPGPDGGSTLSLAGMWYGYVSLPVFQFLLLRWYFRMFIWARFLWQVSRIELNLVPTHPDRLGGLGFLSNTVYAFAAVAMAHGAIVAGQIANRILFLGAALPNFKVEIGVMVAFLMCVVFGPLLFFSPQLSQAKRKGLLEYGTLAQRYVREFDSKWLRGGAPGDEPFVGSGDIQSLADLGNSYEVVKGMRFVPITRDALIQLAAAVLIPIAPLALTMMPLEELLKQLFGLLF